MTVRPGFAFAALAVATLMLLASLALVGYANGVADAAYRCEQYRTEASNG